MVVVKNGGILGLRTLDLFGWFVEILSLTGLLKEDSNSRTAVKLGEEKGFLKRRREGL